LITFGFGLRLEFGEFGLLGLQLLLDLLELPKASEPEMNGTHAKQTTNKQKKNNNNNHTHNKQTKQNKNKTNNPIQTTKQPNNITSQCLCREPGECELLHLHESDLRIALRGCVGLQVIQLVRQLADFVDERFLCLGRLHLHLAK
jgi:hypothetical protein